MRCDLAGRSRSSIDFREASVESQMTVVDAATGFLLNW